MTSPSLVDAALRYARAGIPVLPLHTPAGGRCSCPDPDCSSPGKHPRVRRGVHAATTDLSVVARWWRRWPDANVGLRAGVLFDVCDVDTAEAFSQVTQLFDPASGIGPLAATGRGWHLWVAPTGAGGRAGIIDGVDWRGRDSTVTAPPSLHASGRRYRWIRSPRRPVPTCPPRLLALVRPRQVCDPTPRPTVAQAGPYAAAALAAETQRVRGARPPAAGRPGTRNDTLNRAAFSLGQLVAAGLLDHAVVRAALTDAALDAGLPPAEVRRTIASGLAAGRRQPRAGLGA